MSTDELRWVRVRASGNAARSLRGLTMRSAAEAAAAPLDVLDLELPDLSEYATPLAKAHLLLDTAAEIEHALMVQYLYAAYSLKSSSDASLTAPEQSSVRSWSRSISQTAKEEMGHLMTVQNLLLLIGQPPNLEREDFPPRKQLYPFQMNLEPLTQRSLAKYVVAESPHNASGIDDIISLATEGAGLEINRVGILYAILGVLFSRQEDLDPNAASGDPWYVCVRDIATLIYQTFPDQPPAEFHLPDSNLRPDSFSKQADESWGRGITSIRVFNLKERADCLTALRDISIQGEGMSLSSPGDSHFERFLKAYQGSDGQLSYPPEGDWSPTRAVPTNPVVDVGSNDPNAISDPETEKWARLADQRYALLLALLQQYFTAEETQRLSIQEWCFIGGMYPLGVLSEKLTELNRRMGAMLKAALPFTLPEVVNLPSDDESRLALILRRIRRSIKLVDELLAAGNSDVVLTDIKDSDERLVAALTGDPAPPPRPKPGPTKKSPEEMAMLQLIQTKQPQARNRHSAIPVGDSDLRQLFRDENYAAILEFLKKGTSIRDPQTGKPLVVPGQPDESAFYLQISQDDGVMAGFFDEAEVEVVRRWIVSLSKPPVQKPDRSDPNREMRNLLKRKKIPAQAMHGGIATLDGESLSDLFRSERYDEILEFLKNADSVVDPFSGKPLITAGVPQESAFYLHITDPNGAMVGRFTPDEIAIVERWIESLGADKQSVAVKHFRVEARLIASGFDSPVFIVSPPGDTKRLFVIEQGGAIKILKLSTGKVTATPFLRLDDIRAGGERGLLGLAFHPNFDSNKTFFVNCTNTQGATEIRSYQVSSSSSERADPDSKKVILRIQQPFANHNGGWLAFGPRDGFLYIATGDGGSAHDPHNNAQNTNSLLGKMLRIDVDRDDFPDDDDRNYAIPQTNPFVGRSGARPEIWAYGLRNPWRCSFDRRTGDLYLGDVGQNHREEIDFQPAASVGGENYGWRLREGTAETGLGSTTGLTLVDPIHEYGRTDGFGVIGGYVYRGSECDAMGGVYFFGDLGGRVWSRNTAIKDPATTDRTTELVSDEQHSLENLATFGEDTNGELYCATLSGDLFQITAEETTVDEDRWRETAKIRIHPAIGIARVGNAGFVNGVPATPASSENFFIGPERPFETSPPVGGYKRNGRVRRQAARFRLYAYDANDQMIGEVTADIADIAWTAELANKKASFREFTGLSTSTQLRNSTITGADRSKLEITPGERTLTGPNQTAAFDGGSFTDWENGTPRTVNNIYLGEMQTEDTGRLIILGGEGTAQSPWNRSITSFVNNNGWFDTISDGPVRATVKFKSNSSTLQAESAWVICAPPKFVPALRNVVTLREVLFQIAVDKGWMTIPENPSFRFDIYPILYRALSLKWLLAVVGSNHDVIADAFPPTPTVAPVDIFRRLRSPQAGSNGPGMNMPQLFDDENGWQRNGDRGLTFTRSMYEMLRRWSIGQFVDDWSGKPPEPPVEITPHGLDQAATENCSGGGFFPGIEAGWMLRDTLQYTEPFRLDTTSLKAGDISRQMAVPWQADFYKCTTTQEDGRQVGWWPQQRPDDVFEDGSTARKRWIRNKINSHRDMVDKWHELGFIVDNGTRFVETERNPDSPGVV